MCFRDWTHKLQLMSEQCNHKSQNIVPIQRSYICVCLTDGAARIYFYLSFISPGTCHLMVDDYSTQSEREGRWKKKEKSPEKATSPRLEFEPMTSLSRAERAIHQASAPCLQELKHHYTTRLQNCFFAPYFKKGWKGFFWISSGGIFKMLRQKGFCCFLASRRTMTMIHLLVWKLSGPDLFELF